MRDFEGWLLEKQGWFQGLDPRNYGLLLSRILRAALKKGYQILSLGEAHGYPLFLWKSPLEGPRILVVAGMHGEESAGPWGILRWLETSSSPVALSFIPVVNPTGFSEGKRSNQKGEVPNSGYREIPHPPSGKEAPATEDRILKDKIHLLKETAREGFLSLHEDPEARKFYLFTFSRPGGAGDPQGCAWELCKAGGQVFGIRKKSPKVPDLEGGVVVNRQDGSLEDALFELGVPHCIATETPKGGSFLQRVEANRKIVESFCGWIQDRYLRGISGRRT